MSRSQPSITPPPPKKAAPLPLTPMQSSLIQEVAAKMAQLDSLISVALLSSEGGPFANWLHKAANAEFLAIVRNFDRGFLANASNKAFLERFRCTAMLRRAASTDPRKVVAAAAGAGAGAETDIDTEHLVRTTSAWVAMDSTAKTQKWITLFQVKTADGALVHESVLQFLKANIHSLSRVNEAWQAYKTRRPLPTRAQSLSSLPSDSLKDKGPLAPLVERGTSRSSASSDSVLSSLEALGVLVLESCEEDTPAPLASAERAYDYDGGAAAAGFEVSEAEGPTAQQLEVVRQMTAAGVTGPVGPGGVLVARAASFRAPPLLGSEVPAPSAAVGAKRPRDLSEGLALGQSAFALWRISHRGAATAGAGVVGAEGAAATTAESPAWPSLALPAHGFFVGPPPRVVAGRAPAAAASAGAASDTTARREEAADSSSHGAKRIRRDSPPGPGRS